MATVFLSAGAHTVFGSLWPVPDEGTSLLMYMVHHFLREMRSDPITALHQAQLWMIDPARQPPSSMPPQLVALCDRLDLADPVTWASFTHQGR